MLLGNSNFDWKSFATGFLNETSRQMENDRLENVKYKDELRDDYKIAKKSFADRKSIVGQAMNQVGRLRKLGASDQQIKAAASTGANGVGELATALARQKAELKLNRSLTHQEIDVFVSGSDLFEAGDVAEFIERTYNFSTEAPTPGEYADNRSAIQKMLGINLREGTDAAYGSTPSAFGPSKMDLIEMSRESAYRSLAKDQSSVFLTLDEAQRTPYDASASNLNYLDELSDLKTRLDRADSEYSKLKVTDDVAAEKMYKAEVQLLIDRYHDKGGDEWVVYAPLGTYTTEERQAAKDRINANPNGSSLITGSDDESVLRDALTDVVSDSQGTTLTSETSPDPNYSGSKLSIVFGLDGEPLGVYSTDKNGTVTPVHDIDTDGNRVPLDVHIEKLIALGVFTRSSIEAVYGAELSDANMRNQVEAALENTKTAPLEDPYEETSTVVDSLNQAQDNFDPMQAWKDRNPDAKPAQTVLKEQQTGIDTQTESSIKKMVDMLKSLFPGDQRQITKPSETDAPETDGQVSLMPKPGFSLVSPAYAAERPDAEFEALDMRDTINVLMEELKAEDIISKDADIAELVNILDTAFAQEDLDDEMRSQVGAVLQSIKDEQEDVGSPLMAPGIRKAFQEPETTPLIADGVREAMSDPIAQNVSVPDVTTEELTIDDFMDETRTAQVEYFFKYASERGIFEKGKSEVLAEWQNYGAKNRLPKPLIKMIAAHLIREVLE